MALNLQIESKPRGPESEIPDIKRGGTEELQSMSRREIKRARNRRKHDQENTYNVSFPFPLDRIKLPGNYHHDDFILLKVAEREPVFSTQALAWGIQRGSSVESLRTYLRHYPKAQVEAGWDRLVRDPSGYKFPVLFYAIERNSPDLVPVLANFGAPMDGVADPSMVPALGFAIFHAENQFINSIEVIKALLAQGANPKCTPQEMWIDPLAKPKQVNNGEEDELLKWYIPEFRFILSRTFNLTQRYFVNKAAEMDRPKARKRQFGRIHNISKVLEMPYQIIGQQPAIEVIVAQVFTHISLGESGPFALLFAGPSGHGRTELELKLGALLDAPIIRIDCTIMYNETDLFGPKDPYHGAEYGSTLNNFLVDHKGDRCVVFMDEIEKTYKEVRQALLLPLDSGEYFDRRTLEKIDCSKSIWIFASNHAEETIRKFFIEQMKDESDQDRARVPLDRQESSLRKAYIQELGAPLTGRVTEIIPFLPFFVVEQAVVTYTFTQTFVDDVRKPIDISQKKLVGHIHLDLVDDGRICSTLAKVGYMPELGARTLTRVVEREIRSKLCWNFQDNDTEVKNSSKTAPLARFTMRVEDGESGRVLVAEDSFSIVQEAIKDVNAFQSS